MRLAVRDQRLFYGAVGFGLVLAFAGLASQAKGASRVDTGVNDGASTAACSRASGLRNPSVGPAIRYSERLRIDARPVSGTRPRAQGDGQPATMLCLFNRQTRRAEAVEAPMVAFSSSPALPNYRCGSQRIAAGFGPVSAVVRREDGSIAELPNSALGDPEAPRTYSGEGMRFRLVMEGPDRGVFFARGTAPMRQCVPEAN